MTETFKKAAAELCVLAEKKLNAVRYTEQSFGLLYFKKFSKIGKYSEVQRWSKIENCFSIRNVGLYILEKQQLKWSKGVHKKTNQTIPQEKQ